MRYRIGFRSLWLPAVLVVLSGVVGAWAKGSEPTGSSGKGESDERSEGKSEAVLMYDRGMELAKKGDYEEARKRFEQAVKKEKDNPAFLNMLAYTQRKTGDMEKAFENYEKALKIQPEFPQAREYLGEAHIQAALMQLQILRDYGSKGEEAHEDLVGALKRAAETLNPDAFADPAAKAESGW